MSYLFRNLDYFLMKFREKFLFFRSLVLLEFLSLCLYYLILFENRMNNLHSEFPFRANLRRNNSTSSSHKLYPTHIPTNAIQKLILSAGSALTSILDPHRGDMIATMGETTVITPILEHLHKRMANDVVGRRLLRDRPRINNQTVNMDQLRSFPDGTLGREYVR